MKFINIIITLIGLTILSAMSGCGKHSYGVAIQDDQNTNSSGNGSIETPTTPNVPPRNPVFNNQIDILLMVDFSQNMLEYRQRFADQTENFINQMNKMGIDYHISIMPINIDNNNGIISNLFTQIDYFDRTTPKVIESIEQILNENNMQNALFKRGLDAMSLALSSSANVDGKPNGFLREKSFLNIIFLTGDNDFSQNKIVDYKKILNTLKPPRENGANSWKLSYLGTVTRNVSCIEFKSEGLRYIELAKQSNGLSGNICKADWNTLSSKVSSTNADLLTNYYFVTKPDPKKIVVTINGKNILQDSVNGWNLVEDINTTGSTVYYLHFNGESTPDVYSEIKVTL